MRYSIKPRLSHVDSLAQKFLFAKRTRRRLYHISKAVNLCRCCSDAFRPSSSGLADSSVVTTTNRSCCRHGANVSARRRRWDMTATLYSISSANAVRRHISTLTSETYRSCLGQSPSSQYSYNSQSESPEITHHM
jgi:hypothetical protein